MNISVELLQAKNGDNTLKLNEYFVHSKYNPIKEAEQLVDRQYTLHHTHIIFGYGCGYIVEALLKRRAFEETIIVVDPLFNNQTLELKHQAPNLFAFNSTVIPIFELYINEIAANTRVSFKTICTPNYDKVFPNEYKGLLKKIVDIQYKNRTNDYTLIRYAKDWQRNFIENLRNLNEDSSIEELHRQYNCPVVVASGGPSLTKQIPLLKKYRNNMILISAGSTTNSLISNNIEPDYVVTIDGGEPNYNHFKQLNLRNAEIIYGLQNHYKVRESFSQRGYIIGTESFDKLSMYLETEFNIEFPTLEYGGSVAHAAFNIAHYISSGEIALIGQDLAYTDDLTHAANNKHARKIDEAFIKEREAFQVEGYYGEPVWTNPVFQSMKLDFEALITVKKPDEPFFNCTEGGVKINGFEQITLEDFLMKFSNNEEVTKVKRNNIGLNLDTHKSLKQLLLNLDELKEKLDKGITLLKSIESLKGYDNKSLKKFNSVEKSVNKLLDKIPMEPMTNIITIDILNNYLPVENESDNEAYMRANRQTKALYTQLQEAAIYTESCIKKVLENSEV
ncbi:motility associated factor glycosyltransferase family protein [Lysinibacillus sp. NPDC093688]|uniref:motility associated factor glycosyltransferase family protein n=1 Tax=Lysinibacillus sp. NPDC093688 TaxID=3390577 RepID=UPI003D083E9D